ncbi:hypothetical protein NIES2134_111050 [Thermostichus vulcanus NIES-2134]|nr:hypothetical protein NIES2134_111050 [Thermostichus vulcanus NIES-2134]
MLPNCEGQRISEVTFRTHKGDQWVNGTTHDLFNGKTVVVFALPGVLQPISPTTTNCHLCFVNSALPSMMLLS